MKKLTTTLVLLAALIAAGNLAQAAVTLTLSDPNPGATPGSVVPFLATAFNTDSDEVNLNAISINVDTPLTIDDSPFLSNWFSIAGLSFFDASPQLLFEVTVPGGTLAGLYTGSVTLLGGPDFSDQNILGSAEFTVNVSTSSNDVPEPGTLGLILAPLALAIWRMRRAPLQ
jgi:hypothetical protein